MNPIEPAKVGQRSEPGEYDDGMQALLQIIWGEGYLSPGGPAEVACLLEGSDITGCTVLDVGCGLIANRIGTERARHFVDNWRQLVLVLERGELRPGHLKAVKPRAG